MSSTVHTYNITGYQKLAGKWEIYRKESQARRRGGGSKGSNEPPFGGQ